MGTTKISKQRDSVRVLQINLNRWRAAHNLLGEKIQKVELEVVLVREPNPARIRGGDWFKDMEEAIQLRRRAA